MTPGKAGRPGRVLLFVHQFFPQFHHGTETLAERTAQVYAAEGREVVIVTSILTDPEVIGRFRDSDACPPADRGWLSAPDPPLDREVVYTWGPGIRVHAFTHSHDPRHGRPRFRREVTEPAIEARIAAILAEGPVDRAIVFHLLHVPLAGLALLPAAGVPVTFVATDFFAVCPLGHQQYEDGRDCPGPGPEAVACVRHLSDMTGLVKRAETAVPDWLAAPLLRAYRRGGPYPGRALHPWQGLHWLLARHDATRTFLRACERIIAPSGRIARSLRAEGVPERLIRRMPYGVPPPAAAPARPRLAEPDLRLAFAGAILERKGLHVLLDALARLPAEGWTLDVWGDIAQGKDYGAAQAEAASRFGGRVRLRGTFASGEVHAVLGACDYLVIPSTWAENLPLILLNALQIGLPVVISEAEGLLDAFPEGRVFGRVFRMGDAADLARVLSEELATRPRYDPAEAPPVPTVEGFAAALV